MNISSAPSVIDTTALGRAVYMRFRPPGPPLRRPRPAPIGSLASASTRFVASLARPPAVRRSLRGPAGDRLLSPAALSDAPVRPPRWWTSLGHRTDADHGSAADLPPRGLRLMTQQGPAGNAGVRSAPGRIAGALVADVAPVRRYADVKAAGPMLTQRERAVAAHVNTTAAAPSAPRAARPPGQSSGGAGARPTPVAGVGASSREPNARRQVGRAGGRAVSEVRGAAGTAGGAAGGVPGTASAARGAIGGVNGAAGMAAGAAVGVAGAASGADGATHGAARASGHLGAQARAAAVPSPSRRASPVARTSGNSVAIRRAAFGLSVARRNRAGTPDGLGERFAQSQRPTMSQRTAQPSIARRSTAAAQGEASSAAARLLAESRPRAPFLSNSRGAAATATVGTATVGTASATTASADAVAATRAIPVTQSKAPQKDPADPPNGLTTASLQPLRRAATLPVAVRQIVDGPTSDISSATVLRHAVGTAAVIRAAGIPGAAPVNRRSITASTRATSTRAASTQISAATAAATTATSAGEVSTTGASGRQMARPAEERQTGASAATHPVPTSAPVPAPNAHRNGHEASPHRDAGPALRRSVISRPGSRTQRRSAASPDAPRHGGVAQHSHAADQAGGSRFARPSRLRTAVVPGRSPLVPPVRRQWASTLPGSATRPLATPIAGTASAVPAVRRRSDRLAVRPAGPFPVGSAAALPAAAISSSDIPGMATGPRPLMFNSIAAPIDIPVRAIAGGSPRITSTTGSGRFPPPAPPRGAGGSVRRSTSNLLSTTTTNRGGMPAHSGTGTSPVRRSLVESTAEAFRRAAMVSPPASPGVASGAGSAAVMAASSGLAGSGTPVIRRSLSGSVAAADAPQDAEHSGEVAAVTDSHESPDISRMPAREFHRLVDAVVEAIEQRVVDELERRGRRHPGVF